MEWLLLRHCLIFAICTANSLQLVSGFALGEMPSQTLGYGEALQIPSPTLAPEMELVRRRLDWGFGNGMGKEKKKRDATNVCTEWTIPGGFGQPQCANSETCLFSSASDGYFYEGCGKTSVSYDWITECWDWPQTQIGDAPISQIYCDSDYPACGYLAFVFAPGYTFSNFGCDTSSYELTVELLETAATLATLDESAADGAGAGTETAASSTIIPINNPDIFTTTTSPSNPKPKTTTQTTPPAKTSSSSSTSTIGSHKKKKTPIGPIVGGVVGGIALLALIALLAFFLLRKNKNKNKTNNDNALAAAAATNSHSPAPNPAYQNPSPHILGSELSGAGKPEMGVYIAPAQYPTEKEQAQTHTHGQEIYKPPTQGASTIPDPTLQSHQYTSSQAEAQNRQSEVYRPPPGFVSPNTTGNTIGNHSGDVSGNTDTNTNTMSMSYDSRTSSPPPLYSNSNSNPHMNPDMNAGEMQRPVSPIENAPEELEGHADRRTGVYEINGTGVSSHNRVHTPSYNYNTPATAGPGRDMSGNALSEEWGSRGHELE